MSRIRRISLAATAAAAVLALAIPSGASAISISTTSGGGTYDMSGEWTHYDMSDPGTGSSSVGVFCYEYVSARPKSGWGIADGQASTPFLPPFPAFHPIAYGGCQMLDDGSTGGSPAVQGNVIGALMLTLTGLRPGQSPLSPKRQYDGKLWLHSYSSISFRPEKHPGCTVTIAGPQSVDLDEGGQIMVDDDRDEILLDVSYVEFATTKTAGCPSTIGNSVTILHHGWTLKNVTVTP